MRQVEEESVNEPCAEKIRCPTQEYDREEFYKTLDNVRYLLKINMTNGQQASDIPVGIEDLIDFLGDVEAVIKTIDGISVEYRDHSHWTARLNTGIDDSMMNEVDWKSLEKRIEKLAKGHGIALKKSVSMSGRGYTDSGHRSVSVHYSFGTKGGQGADLIQCENNPLSKIAWVGGELGRREELNKSELEVKSIESKNMSGVGRIMSSVVSVFSSLF